MARTMFVTEKQGERAVHLIMELVEEKPHQIVVGGEFLDEMKKLAKEILEANT